MVTETSRQAYMKLMAQGKITPMQELVYKTIDEYNRPSDYEIAEILGKQINTITPRRKELQELMLIREDGQRYNPKTKMMQTVWVCGKPKPKEHTGLSHVEFENILKKIDKANNYQLRQIYTLLCLKLKLP